MPEARPDSRIDIYTDGACSRNPGPGGWAALLIYRGREKVVSGGEMNTTNNRMELQAAIGALSAVRRRCPLRVVTDSQYVKNGVERWLARWKENGWKTSDKKPVKNMDLWQELDRLTQRFEIEWRWVRGHSGHPQNERVDELARRNIPGGA